MLSITGVLILQLAYMNVVCNVVAVVLCYTETGSSVAQAGLAFAV